MCFEHPTLLSFAVIAWLGIPTTRIYPLIRYNPNMDASELGRWTRFAAKGGIGKCTALQDCIAEQAEDLMFMKVRSPLHMIAIA